MKVRDLIRELDKLDGNKDIWILYDYYLGIEPRVREASEDDETTDIKRGDYVMEAY